jgi:hypothetical protein
VLTSLTAGLADVARCAQPHAGVKTAGKWEPPARNPATGGDRRAGSLDPKTGLGGKVQGPLKQRSPSRSVPAGRGNRFGSGMFDSHAVESAVVSPTGHFALQRGHETRDPILRAGCLCANGSGSPSKPSGSRPSSSRRSQNEPRAGIELLAAGDATAGDAGSGFERTAGGTRFLLI